MGWDAFAGLRDSHKAEFQAAANRVTEKCGGVDPCLQNGYLDFSRCGQELENATGCSVYDQDGWPAEKVKRLAGCAVWLDDEIGEDDIWALESAREFLDTCAAIDSGISFSF